MGLFDNLFGLWLLVSKQIETPVEREGQDRRTSKVALDGQSVFQSASLFPPSLPLASLACHAQCRSGGKDASRVALGRFFGATFRMAPPRPRPARAHTSLREGSRAGRRRGGARRKSNTEHPTQGNGSRVLPPRPALGKGTSLFAFPEKGSSFLHVGECLVGPKSQRKRWNQYRCLVGPESQRRRWNQYMNVW